MGKESREVRKTLKGIGSLGYVEIRNVPTKSYPGYGDAVEAKVLAEIEKQVARELILRRIPLRGLEVEYLRSIFGLSMRELGSRLGLSHVSIIKWERAKHKPLDLVNEVAIKALIAGMLGLRLPASIESLSGEGAFPRKLVLDYAPASKSMRKRVA